MSNFSSPFEGEVTAGFRGYPGHNGTDIRPAKRYTYGNPVAAMLPGKVVEICRTQKHGDKTRGIFRYASYGYLTGNGVIVENADTEYQIYNHVLPLKNLKVGQMVEAGEIIAENDNSGNQTGAHLHLEYRRFDKAKGCYMPHNATYLFHKYGVKIGAPISVIKPSSSKPVASKPPVSKPKPPVGKKYTTVKHGSKNSTVGKVQQALRNKKYTKQIVDNDFGDQTSYNIRHFQKNNGLYVDGIAGEKTQKKLGL